LTVVTRSRFVFPSATHTRFEHSLGVAIKAKEMATHIWTGQRKELGLDQADINTVELAGARAGLVVTLPLPAMRSSAAVPLLA